MARRGNLLRGISGACGRFMPTRRENLPMPKPGSTVALALTAMLTACQPAVRPGVGASPRIATVEIQPAEDWRAAALPEHAGISEDLPPLFARLAAAARPGASDRELLDPAISLPAATPAPGAYRCRIVRLPTTPGRRERASPRPAFCFVGAEDERLSLTLETPARRLGGFLWPTADRRRLVFLGAGFAPPARTAPPYSATPGANTAGLFERIGDFRYRLVARGAVPGTVDIYELVAAPPGR